MILDCPLGNAELSSNLTIAQILEPMQQENLATTRWQATNRFLDACQILLIGENAVRLRLGRRHLRIVYAAMAIQLLRARLATMVGHDTGSDPEKQRAHLAGVAALAIAQHAQKRFLDRIVGHIPVVQLSSHVATQTRLQLSKQPGKAFLVSTTRLVGSNSFGSVSDTGGADKHGRSHEDRGLAGTIPHDGSHS